MIELLPSGTSSSSRRNGAGGSGLDVLTEHSGNNSDTNLSGYTRRNMKEPPKALFDDI